MLAGGGGLLPMPPMALAVLVAIEQLADPPKRAPRGKSRLDLWKQGEHGIP